MASAASLHVLSTMFVAVGFPAGRLTPHRPPTTTRPISDCYGLLCGCKWNTSHRVDRLPLRFLQSSPSPALLDHRSRSRFRSQPAALDLVPATATVSQFTHPDRIRRTRPIESLCGSPCRLDHAGESRSPVHPGTSGLRVLGPVIGQNAPLPSVHSRAPQDKCIGSLTHDSQNPGNPARALGKETFSMSLCLDWAKFSHFPTAGLLRPTSCYYIYFSFRQQVDDLAPGTGRDCPFATVSLPASVFSQPTRACLAKRDGPLTGRGQGSVRPGWPRYVDRDGQWHGRPGILPHSGMMPCSVTTTSQGLLSRPVFTSRAHQSGSVRENEPTTPVGKSPQQPPFHILTT